MNIFTLSSHRPFLPTFIEGLQSRFGKDDDPLSLSRITILLPTRRAVTALREEFVQRNPHRAMILPHIIPLGDLNPAEIGLVEADLLVPPAISPLERQTRLAQMIKERADGALSYDQCLRLARALADLLDDVTTSQIPWGNLSGLVPSDYAAHWGITLDFLKLITADWPLYLQERNLLDPAERRNRVLAQQSALWTENPPIDPVIIAGSTGSIPATRQLMKVIANLPQGAVVLPALDKKLDVESWQDISETHPQYALKQVLDFCDVQRGDAENWCAADEGNDPPCVALWREIMRPAVTTPLWQSLTSFDEKAFSNLAVIEADTQQQEADIIALKVREELEDPDKSVMIVAQDRMLAARIRASLRRYHIMLDDAAGQPLVHTALGNFLHLLYQVARPPLDVIALLALLKHPLCGLGMALPDLRRQVRLLEREVFRGARLPGTLDVYRPIAKDSAPLLEHLIHLFESWFAGFSRDEARPFGEWLQAHLRLAETVAATSDVSGAARLWQSDAGLAAAPLLRNLYETTQHFPVISADEYGASFLTLIGGEVVRPRYGLHPRVHLLSPVEARLQQADLVIMAGLNEGSWPAEPQPDPWMSRPMRYNFGLPLPERFIGLSAHDFVQHACQGDVVLTRSGKNDGSPQTRSRWLERLVIVLQATNQFQLIDQTIQWRSWIQVLDHARTTQQIPQPRPTPPLSARPRRLSVTSVELWRRDPYSLYARHILKLRALDNLAEDPDVRLYGEIVHRVLQNFMKAHHDAWPGNAEDILLTLGEQEFQTDFIQNSALYPFWRAKFAKLAHWFIRHEQTLRNEGRQTLALESLGQYQFEAPGGLFTLYGIADRIDRLADGRLIIVDYKTGSKPDKREQELGYAPQLPLLGLIAHHGGFPAVAPAAVAGMEYWDFVNAPRLIELDPDTIETGLKSWITLYDNPETPYIAQPYPDYAPRFSDYLHLARVKEWSLLEAST